MGGDTTWEASYEDPLRCRPDGCGQELRNRAPPQVEEVSNDACSVKFLMMHKPTHDPKREKTGEYPFSWHLSDKKRLWEFRMQIRFNRPPEGKVWFGVELDRFVPVSGITKQAQNLLVGACKRIVGDCYHTVGDDPAKAQGEKEAPHFVMPLWAFDQFHVAEAGQEPPLTADLSGVGLCRAERDVSKYISALQSVINSFSTDKVYTFCFWGVSKFLDIMRWEVTGMVMPMNKDFNALCGAPPVYLTIYELPGVHEQDNDARHLASRKRQYFRAAVWSALKPLNSSASAPPQEVVNDYWTSVGGYGEASGGYQHPQPGGYQHPQPSVDASSLGDLLGLDDDAAPAAAKVEAPAAPKQAENVDLLGIF